MYLTEKENKTYETIDKVIKGTISRKEAMCELHRSRQQIYRLIKIYKQCGKDGFIHKGRGKISPNKKDARMIEELEQLYLTEYYDYNFEAFFEEIKYKRNISYDTMLKHFTADDIISPLAHKKTIKVYNDKMKTLSDNSKEEGKDKIELFKSRMIEVEKAHIRRSSNLYCFGQEVQMDASCELWFNNTLSFLHLAVDKATKKVLAGWFEYEEVTRGYFVVLFNTIINYGIPQKIKADNRSSFTANNAKNKINKHFLTQFGKICEELNIVLETSSMATAKPNVERENGVFKNRLIAEMRHEGIKTIDEANDYLNNIFIPKMNKKFSYKINFKTSKMRTNNYTLDELNLIISEKYNRIIDNASTIRYNKKYYIPINIETGEVVTFLKGTECTFIITYNGEYYCKIEHHYYQLAEIESRDYTMVKESEKPQTKEKEHHKYIPPKNHPWRKNMMLKH